MNQYHTDVEAKIDKSVFIPSFCTVLVIMTFLISFEEQSETIIQTVFNFVVEKFGVLYIWAAVSFFGAILWLCFGRYGQVKLGGEEAKPEFSRISWIGMFFCSGIGTSLIYWSSIEWTYYYAAPPFGIEANSQAAAEYAAMYGMYHWGPIAWAFYCLCAFPIGYAYYNRKKKALRLSEACSGVIGDKNAKGWMGKVIDILVIFGLVGGTGTSLASGTPMLSEAISNFLGIERSGSVDIAVVVIWTLIFSTSVFLGLKKGIKVLSDLNLIALAIICSIIFIGGPTIYMISLFTDSVGLMMSNFTRMSLYTDTVGGSNFPQWWTIFYWAWWVAYGPYMGIFIARISKGRTFKDIGLTVITAGSLGCMLFFMIFGNTSMYAEFNGVFPVLDTIKEQGTPAAILGVLQSLPWSALLLPLFICVGFIYSGTTVDSSSYVLASIASKDIEYDQEPSRANRLFWALLLGFTGLVVMNIGGLEAIKTVSLIVGLPLVLLMSLSFASLVKWLREDFDAMPIKEQIQLQDPSREQIDVAVKI
ncbi:BCCT family transporter [Vibrio kyushuensis]|uniref:BCCT family transporter n=1 Tax=Vibrio kyushuensis TaxID=2910249 RepID=UPI003D134347